LKPLFVIPARGGSKGIPRKNIKLLNGKPLIHYTINAVRGIVEDSRIYVSTDDAEIKLVAEQTGLNVPFIRPGQFATDTASTRDVLLHAEAYADNCRTQVDTIILLQPTSPFRGRNHILEAMQLYKKDLDMVVSVKETKANPYSVLFEEDSNGYLLKSKPANFTRRQDCPVVWEVNGAVYIICVNQLKEMAISDFTKVIKYPMDELSSHDIDTPFDWEIAEIIASKMIAKNEC
jgi:CMP-N,N'-diacetyllegionaminic acid synthase